MNDALGRLPPLARLLFAGLWTICDRSGRVLDRPARIKAEVLPYDDCDADDLLSKLAEAGFIDRYVVDGVGVLHCITWDKHQNPHVKEVASTLPCKCTHQTSTGVVPDSHVTSTILTGLIPSSLIPDSSPLIPDSKVAPTALAGKPARPRSVPFPCPDGVDPQVWTDWLALRKAKKAPVTQTVVEGALAESAKAGLSLGAFLRVWCTQGSQGMRADWIKPDVRREAAAAETAWQRSQRERVAEMTGGLASRKGPGREQEASNEATSPAPQLLG